MYFSFTTQKKKEYLDDTNVTIQKSSVAEFTSQHSPNRKSRTVVASFSPRENSEAEKVGNTEEKEGAGVSDNYPEKTLAIYNFEKGKWEDCPRPKWFDGYPNETLAWLLYESEYKVTDDFFELLEIKVREEDEEIKKKEITANHTLRGLELFEEMEKIKREYESEVKKWIVVYGSRR
ncbi:MAG: hypothetical protein COU07_02945 [Candidatus Harrisonbacteria bacterium CG10_big_fil_rev_8_21_14_0_10_40_38]|uniref:Uncharacterized protein n=1 Tax=Candidatus Harrisonbacteria bacterium CG10_big_fil_rev_8_21_14_0_10_40_38 TaxID=1974583 RepID=A0A2H0US23_9BACT|nr:MAG: hypothetical protein COU07_02945 [Candidatus Harrisonbacteria bacterium CG10_big_fil_rev_8_21_14_0_10_40_38]